MEHQVYFWAALVGGTLLLLQVVMQVIGLGHDVETDGGTPDADASAGDAHDPAHGGNLFFGILSFKALVAFAGIFGLTGLALERTELSGFHRVSLAVLAGLLAMVCVAWLMRMLHGLSASGTLVVGNAVGHQAEVYLRVPGGRTGRGKVTLELQGRTVELGAVTDGEAIPTGALVRVLEVVGGELLNVAPLTTADRR
jgi:hypothetical protein